MLEACLGEAKDARELLHINGFHQKAKELVQSKQFKDDIKQEVKHTTKKLNLEHYFSKKDQLEKEKKDVSNFDEEYPDMYFEEYKKRLAL